ncbi:hypothetical protein [Halorarius litoreus]|uniref:hypothetical protein n=1 Tax=Halorarius litoreus TaxID=2962676 RepID=UPI0020CCB82D|nr:hypothetical protein [Halorarius litoreus]
MAWALPTDPVTLAVLLFVLLFSVFNWLRWRSKGAWLDRVLLEQQTEDPDEEDI